MSYTMLSIVFLFIACIGIWRLYKINRDNGKKIFFKKLGFTFLASYVLIAGILFIVFL